VSPGSKVLSMEPRSLLSRPGLLSFGEQGQHLGGALYPPVACKGLGRLAGSAGIGGALSMWGRAQEQGRVINSLRRVWPVLDL
jgi:hypothetical protein